MDCETRYQHHVAGAASALRFRLADLGDACGTSESATRAAWALEQAGRLAYRDRPSTDLALLASLTALADAVRVTMEVATPAPVQSSAQVLGATRRGKAAVPSMSSTGAPSGASRPSRKTRKAA
jgi:hypothetical protein